MPTVRVVIADDHPVVRSGIRDMLDGTHGIEVVGEAASGPEALEQVKEKHPDVLLLDVEMPEMSGVEVAQHLQEQSHPVRLLALSSYDDQEYVQGLLDGGASGYLTKENAPELIVEAVQAVAEGEVRWFVQPSVHDGSSPELTFREKEILRLIAKGYSNDGVAEQLGISESTVRTHATNIYRKINADSAREAIAWAWQNGIMSPSDDERAP